MRYPGNNTGKKLLFAAAMVIVLLIVYLAIAIAGGINPPAGLFGSDNTYSAADTAPLSTLPPETQGSQSPKTEAPQPVDAPEASPEQADYPEEISYDDGGIDEDGTYSGAEDVAYYLHTYGHLPDNYITKDEAEDAGWESAKGNLWDVAYGMSIGGDRFGNYEGLLPAGEQYYECDVNYSGGYRGSERLIYSDDGDVYYTSNHYKSFEQLY